MISKHKHIKISYKIRNLIGQVSVWCQKVMFDSLAKEFWAKIIYLKNIFKPSKNNS